MKEGDRVVILIYPMYGQRGTLLEKIDGPVAGLWTIKLDIPTIQEGQPIEIVAAREHNFRLLDEV